jgi:hypothetical protein
MSPWKSRARVPPLRQYYVGSSYHIGHRLYPSVQKKFIEKNAPPFLSVVGFSLQFVRLSKSS